MSSIVERKGKPNPRPSPPGLVRCIVCKQDAHQTAKGFLKPHPTAAGEPCTAAAPTWMVA